MLLLIPLGLAALLYLGAALSENRRGNRTWPAHRSLLWLLGLAVIAATLAGHLAERAHTDFAAHMAAHLLAGMLAPLLLALSAPITLALRTIHVESARRLSHLLNSRLARFLTHPIPAAALNVGSLWVLYTTPLSQAMLANPILHYLLLAHFFAAGYLFTVSIVSIDPAPHRASFRLRMTVLILVVAAHSILAKYIYIHPPPGTSPLDAERSGLLMYYGGDLIEIALIIAFFTQWYTATKPQHPAPSRPLR
ncbi:cytochrome c oxidase assembly protein [Arthrobacter sp. SF27]|nr:cytochrome c oxidase assembly protein [Arthrobacter sp. SF27]